MKNLKLTFILICILLFAISNLQAQAPEKINYQAVARNLAGNPLVNQAVGLEFNIRQGSPTGAVVYSETHTGVSTNQFGLFTAEIGGGTVNSGIFSAINWGLSSFYLQVTIDGNILPATQLLSVPFALYAKESANGPAGLPGKNSLSLSTPYTGPACINGGTQVDAGLDDNNDGTLQPLEIDYTYIICNGTNGTNGTNGLPGSNGVDGISIDSTINNNNGTFTIYYSNGTSFTTSDLTGPAGTNGTSGTTYFAGNGISLSGDTITNLGDLDNNPTNELQILSVSNDTIFLSNGGFAPLPSAGGFWTQLGGSIHNNNIGKVGIGTSTPIHQLSVASNDSVVASFLGTNPSVSAIVVANVNPNAATGIVFFNGTDTTSYIFLNPTTNTLAIRNNSVNGNIQISTDSVLVNQGLILVNQAQNSIYNQSDTIYSYSSSGEIINVNSGLFLTDSLYVLGSNATNTNWILANDGFGQAKWTDPSTIVGSVGDNWGSQVVIHDTTLTGTGIVGDSLSVNPNIIPTQTSQLTNNSGFITSPDDADNDPTNELQNLAFNTFGDSLFITNGNGVQFSAAVPAPGQVLSWNGTNWSAANAGVDTDNQNISFNATGDSILIANGNGLQFSTIMPAASQVLQFDGTNWTAVNLTDTDPTNELQDLSNGGKVGNNQIINISGGAGVTFSVADADSSATNEIQTLSLAGDTLSISGGNNVNLSTLSGTTYTAGTGINLTGDTVTNTAPDQTVVITGFGSTTVGGPYPNFSITSTDNQTLTATPSPGSILLDISGGNSVTLGINDADASPANELITSFAVNGTSDSLVIMEGINNYKAVPLTSLAAAANAWNLTGNTLTTPATDFIGTIDNVPLNFRVNNTKAGRIDSTNNEATFGYNALLSNTSGAQITAIGANALKNNTTGTENTAVGYNTLANVTTVFGNTAVGSRALSLATTNGNSAVGYGALELNVAGANNTAMGMFSLRESTSGFNAAFGYYSLAFNTSGGNNTAMGYNVFGSNTTGSNNTAVGYNAGVTNISGANNTLIGANTDVFNNNLINATAIGANTVVNQSNSLILGNGANVGIGTPTPKFKLHVSSNDTIISAFTGANASGSVIMVNNSLPNMAGMLMKSGPDTAFVGYNSLDNNLELETFDQTNGNIRISTGKKIELRADTIFIVRSGGLPIFNINKGTFFTDSLYVFGPGYNTAGNVLTTNGNGKAEWASPSGAANAWNLTGNAGTNATTHFIGTTDNVALNFRVDNQIAGKVDNVLGNTFFGFLAGTSTTGSFNTANGWYALFSNTTGNKNTAYGMQALYSSTSGSWNTAIGEGTLSNNDAGSEGVAIGYQSQYYVNNNTTPWTNTNTSVGMLALRGSGTSSANTGLDNTAIGHRSMLNNTSGGGNTAVGYNSLYTNSTGSNNTTNGHRSLYSNTSGNANTAIGTFALYANTIGVQNTANGYNSLGLNTQGNYNTAYGFEAGITNTTGSNNTFIGMSADVSINNLTNATAIGYNAKVAQSNSLVLGGTGADAVNVGIGTASPQKKLDIAGDIGLKEFVFISPGTTYNNFNTQGFSFVHLECTFNTVLNGIAGGTDGKVLVLYINNSATSGGLTINNQNIGAAIIDRIETITGANITVPAGNKSVINLIYSANESRWIITSIR